MTGRVRAFTVLAGAILAIVPAGARAEPAGARAEPAAPMFARDHVQAARREGNYTYCSKPKRPLGPEARELCAAATEVDGCAALVAACKGDAAPKKEPLSATWAAVLAALAALAKGLVWLLVALVIAAVAAPIVLAIVRARRNKAVADAPKSPNVARSTDRARLSDETPSDGEAALREADEHARRGELARALSLYLAASLAALDRRGAIRLARHRTNGEYVRACATDPSCGPLRDIVREVDRVEFGNVAPTAEEVARVGSRATSLVRGSGGAIARAATSIATGLLMVLALVSMGCGGGQRSHVLVDDPAGDELPMDVLRRSGYAITYLPTSLAALPLPEAGRGRTPILVIDVQRVALEDESSTRLLRWVDAGGVLILFGAPSKWPDELKVTEQPTAGAGLGLSDSVEVVTDEVDAHGARVGTPHALVWAESEPIAFIGDTNVYAAHKSHGKGVILGVAGRELFTNIGVSRPDNAGALAALIEIAMTDRAILDVERGVTSPTEGLEIQVARREDGIPPPSNPFSALIRAGLGRGVWHALAAAVVLFLAFGIRQARARPETPPARRAFAEHVEATGAFYGRARALGHALASYGRYAEMRLRERVPRGESPAQFLATRANVAPEEAERVWRRATEASADDPARGDELATIRDLGAMLGKALDAGTATLSEVPASPLHAASPGRPTSRPS